MVSCCNIGTDRDWDCSIVIKGYTDGIINCSSSELFVFMGSKKDIPQIKDKQFVGLDNRMMT